MATKPTKPDKGGALGIQAGIHHRILRFLLLRQQLCLYADPRPLTEEYAFAIAIETPRYT